MKNISIVKVFLFLTIGISQNYSPVVEVWSSQTWTYCPYARAAVSIIEETHDAIGIIWAQDINESPGWSNTPPTQQWSASSSLEPGLQWLDSWPRHHMHLVSPALGSLVFFCAPWWCLDISYLHAPQTCLWALRYLSVSYMSFCWWLGFSS